MKSHVHFVPSLHRLSLLLAGRGSRRLLLIATLTLCGPGAAFGGDILISEFRFRGPNGANDEFIELYNNTDSNVLVATLDGSAGWALAASDGITRFIIPNGTVIPPRRNYLATNLGYSLDAYGGGAFGDISYSLDIPDGFGIALFRTADPLSFSLATRLDAVGYSTALPLYREGNGFSGIDPFNVEFSLYRNRATGRPQDTDDNTADFLGVDTAGTLLSTGQRLGAPGPENLSSPVVGLSNLFLLAPAACSSCAPNRVRDTTSPSGTTGVLIIRRYFTNTTGRVLNQVRFRVVDITTFPTPIGTADLRPVTSADTLVTLTDGTVVNVRGTILEEPPFQDFGGGWNSTLTFSPQGLAPGASIPLQFVLAVERGGAFRFFVNTESD